MFILIDKRNICYFTLKFFAYLDYNNTEYNIQYKNVRMFFMVNDIMYSTSAIREK